MKKVASFLSGTLLLFCLCPFNNTFAQDAKGYDPAKDALIVGAAFAKKLADTLGIKMFETALKPGDSLPLHSHPDHAIYILESGTVVLYPQGQAKGDTISNDMTGTGWITGPFNDAIKNIGNNVVRWLEIDFNRPRTIEMPAKPTYDSTMDLFNMGESVQKIADTLGIKLFVLTMKPGDSLKMHSHPDHSVYVIEGGEVAITDQDGSQQKMKVERGMGFVRGPVSDAVKNTGTTTVKVLMSHIYRQRTN